MVTLGIWKRPDGGRNPWRATYSHPYTRKTVRAPNGFPTKGAATAWRDRSRAEVLASGGGYDPTGGQITLAAFIRLVWQPQRRVAESTERRDRAMKPRLARWDDWPLASIRPSHVRAWARELVESETPHTAYRALDMLRGILQLAKEDGRIPSNPADGATVPAPPPHEDRTLTDDEVRRIIDAMPYVGYRVFTETLAKTGLRWAECAALPDRLVDTSAGVLRVRWTIDARGKLHEYVKGSADAAYRDVPIPESLGEVIDAWREVRGASPEHDAGGLFLFVSRQRHGSMRYAGFRSNTWATALATAGIAEPLPTPHDLRHYYATKLGAAGMGERNIGALLGHSASSQVTRRYVQPTESRFDQARKIIS